MTMPQLRRWDIEYTRLYTYTDASIYSRLFLDGTSYVYIETCGLFPSGRLRNSNVNEVLDRYFTSKFTD